MLMYTDGMILYMFETYKSLTHTSSSASKQRATVRDRRPETDREFPAKIRNAGGFSGWLLLASFSSYSTTMQFAEIADKVTEEFTLEREEKFGLDQSSEEEEEDRAAKDDFEFSFVYRDTDASQSISADEIFSNGKIRPIFPIFDQNLLLLGSHDNPVHNKEEEHSNKKLLTKASSGRRLPLSELFTERDLSSSTSSSSESEECERVRSGTYCIWTPKSVPSLPITCKKCHSCGSPRRFRLKDLLHRSNSDVSDSFVFFSPSSSSSKNRSRPKNSSEVNEKSSEILNNPMPEKKKKKNDVKAKAKKISSHEHYLRNRALKEGDRRRTYLPYRRDLIGFFGYLSGWSFGKVHHPFQTV